MTEETVRAVAARMLGAFGFEPVVATSGREAIALFRGRDGAFAAVLLDLTMPQMDGAEAFIEENPKHIHMENLPGLT